MNAVQYFDKLYIDIFYTTVCVRLSHFCKPLYYKSLSYSGRFNSFVCLRRLDSSAYFRRLWFLYMSCETGFPCIVWEIRFPCVLKDILIPLHILGDLILWYILGDFDSFICLWRLNSFIYFGRLNSFIYLGRLWFLYTSMEIDSFMCFLRLNSFAYFGKFWFVYLFRGTWFLCIFQSWFLCILVYIIWNASQCDFHIYIFIISFSFPVIWVFRLLSRLGIFERIILWFVESVLRRHYYYFLYTK